MSNSSEYEINIYENSIYEESCIRFTGRTRSDAMTAAIGSLINGVEQTTGCNFSELKCIPDQACDEKSRTGDYLKSVTNFAPDRISNIREKLEFLFDWCCDHHQEVAHCFYSNLDWFCEYFQRDAEEEWTSSYESILEAIDFAKQYDVIENEGQFLWANDGNRAVDYLALIKALVDCFKYAETKKNLSIKYTYERYGSHFS